MTKYLIVSADGASGRGSRGMSLYWFLSTYHGWGAVKIISTKELRENAYSAETVFFGLPSEATKDDLTHVRYRQLVIFDYQDAVQVLIDPEREFLRGLTKTYLKVWNEPGWPAEWNWGVLPIRRQMRLPLYLRFLKLQKLFGVPAPDRVWDVSFLGAATGQELRSQRVEWLREIRGTRGRIKFWGGLVAPPAYREQLTRSGVDSNGLFYDGGRIGFNRFFDLMRKSKAVLTPMGNARWSYRHYEAIYAGAIPVSCDMRQAKVLIPLPLDGMVHVPDGTPALPRIEEALNLPTLTQGVREANIEFLERYLTYGDYSRRKPELMDRMLEQLPS